MKKRWDARIEAQLETQRPQMLTEVSLQVAKNQQALYDEHVAFIKRSFDNTPINELEGLLRRTAAKMGLAVVPRDETGNPKLTPTVLVPDSQDTHMGNTPLSPQRTVDAVDKLITDKQKAGSNVASSIHNPQNVMVDDTNEQRTLPPPAAPPVERQPENSEQIEALKDLPPTPENALLKMLLAGVTNINKRMEQFEERLQCTENGPRNDPRPPRQATERKTQQATMTPTGNPLSRTLGRSVSRLFLKSLSLDMIR